MALVVLGVLTCLLPIRIVDCVGDVDVLFLRLKVRSLVRQVVKLHWRWLICVVTGLLLELIGLILPLHGWFR